MDNKVLYAHYKETDNQIFYIGYGTPSRPYSRNRGEHWYNVINKYGYYVEILAENLSDDRAIELEIKMISFYGRIDLGQGTLINKTDGGDIGGNGIFGENHHSYDHQKYKFQKGNLVVEKTRFDFCNEYNLSRIMVMRIAKGTGGSHKGWVCLNPDKEFKPKEKPSYTFTHKDGTIEICTQRELINKYQLHSGAISGVISGSIKSHKGWTLVK